MTSYYFYDLETTSGSPRDGRIMQFAGQRTDENLQLIGEPDNLLVKLAGDVLPDPEAILVHGITPQKTLEEGLTEAEFSKYFADSIAVKGTVFIGFNNIRFDDEFVRRICYRTFVDPYQWHWKDGRSRWDLLDPIRMMRALRPNGMKWPSIDGKPTVKLELMAKKNGILHENAHDALSDVIALIELAKKFKSTQPKLFSYLLSMRDKKQVAELVSSSAPFVYTSGKYSSDFEKTTVVLNMFKHPRRDSAIVYDLRSNPEKWLNKSIEEIQKHWQVRYGDDLEPLPVKTIQFNRCPAVAPMSVLDDEAQSRIKIDLKTIDSNRKKLVDDPKFVDKLKSVLDIIENEQQSSLPLNDSVDYQLYDGFWGSGDQAELLQVRTSDVNELTELSNNIKNKRIREMIPLYKARNFPKSLSPKEKADWEAYKKRTLLGVNNDNKLAKFYKRLEELALKRKLTPNDEYLLTELRLYVESLVMDLQTEDQSE